ncbi:hypothetical protein V6L76_20955, partial [Pannonibacter sp. Pt2]
AVFRRAVIFGRLLRVRGRLEREGCVVHLIAVQIDDLSDLLLGLVRIGGEISSGVGIASSCGVCDLLVGRAVGRDPRDEGKLFQSRDFR